MSETPPTEALHPLERMPGITKRLTLPLSGVSVLVRKVSVRAIQDDFSRTLLSMPALREVAVEWAKQSTEEARDPAQPIRPRPELAAAEMAELQRRVERGVARAAVVQPKLDELIALYGGDESEPDFGMADDYDALMAAIEELNPAEEGGPAKQQAQMFPVPERGEPEQPRQGVRKKAK